MATPNHRSVQSIVTDPHEMLRRFLIIFMLSIPLQWLAIRLGGRFWIIYTPFLDLAQPFVIRHYGGNDGSLGLLFLWGMLFGTVTYSAVLAVVGAFLTRSRPPTPKAHV